MLSFLLSDVPSLNPTINPSQGLIRLGCFKRLIYFFRVKFFKRYVAPNQPTFFISSESWHLLFSGQSLNHDGSINNWLKEKNDNDKKQYEIFAFVFCIAFGQLDIKGENIAAYFRIRSILRQNGEDELWVETENIAYVNLNQAFFNPLENSLKFISQIPEIRRVAFKKQIDDDVYSTKQEIEKEKERKESLEEQLVKLPPMIKQKGVLTPIKNEGAIFGKERISTELKTYGAIGGGSTIKFAWNPSNSDFNFVISINPDYATESIPCPPPIPACKNV